MNDIERRLAATLKGVSERHLDGAPRRLGAAQNEITRRVRRRWGFFVVGVSAVAALALSAVAVSVPQLLSERTQFPSGGAELVPVTTTIEIGDDPVAIAADDEAVWVALRRGLLQRIDAANNEDISSIEVAPSLTDVAVGAGQVWATGALDHPRKTDPIAQHALYRIHPPREFVHAVEQGQQNLAVTPESVWSISTEPNAEGGTLNRVTFEADDEQHGGVSEFESTGWRPEGIVADGDSLWTVGNDGGAVIRELDGVTGEVQQEFVRQDEFFTYCDPCGPATSPIAVGDGSVVGMWETNEAIGLLDQDTDAIRLLDVAIEIGETRAVAISEGAAWVVIENDRVVRIDLETGELVGAPIEVGSDPVDIAAGAGAVWTINQGDGTVTRIDLVERDSAPDDRAIPDDETSPDEDPTPLEPSPSATPHPEDPTPLEPSPSPTPDLDDAVGGLDIDTQMTELIDALGARCKNFDFQSREEFAGRPYRPTLCNEGADDTILLFSFATEEDRQAWADGGRESDFPQARSAPIVIGPAWEAHVIDASLAREVADNLEGEFIMWRGEGPSE